MDTTTYVLSGEVAVGQHCAGLAQQKRRILYVEGKTDLEILRAWAAVLEHRLLRFLQEPLWKRMAETN